ncbi:MAG: protein-export protein SecB [Caulobacter sp.]|nr:protein-export protein SecB [Caulobacter sp.]
MTDLNPLAPAGDDPNAPSFRIVTQYLRDLSFEHPHAPESLRQGGEQPQIDMGVEMNARGRPDGLFEVDLKLSARATRGEDAVFHVEVLYGGLFQISNVPEDEMEPVLLIECPRFLFPFARRVIADVTSEGGFPPFLLDPIDFGAVYLARKAQAEGVAGNA